MFPFLVPRMGAICILGNIDQALLCWCLRLPERGGTFRKGPVLKLNITVFLRNESLRLYYGKLLIEVLLQSVILSLFCGLQKQAVVGSLCFPVSSVVLR